jgi:transcriptional regulator with GAF, ATPase, and Fis domain
LAKYRSICLQKYSWPRNVRELQHVLERACIVATDGRLRFDLPVESSKPQDEPTLCPTPKHILTDAEVRQFEANNIRAAFESSKGRIYGVDGAAARLGMKPTTLTSRIKTLGIGLDK